MQIISWIAAVIIGVLALSVGGWVIAFSMGVGLVLAIVGVVIFVGWLIVSFIKETFFPTKL